jgi:16S rRNA (uracil1498-N3)-methyltransferase
MNLILLTEADFISATTVAIHDERLSHIQQVLKSQVGDSLTVGKLNGLVGTGIITQLTDDAVELQISLTEEPPKPLPLTVVLALPRPQMLKRIVQNIAEFGIKELHLIHSQKVEKSFWQTPNLKPAALHQYLSQGLMQAKDTQLPNIYLHPQFKPFVEDVLPTLMNDKQALIAHPYTDTAIPERSEQPRLVMIGPEGGFTAYEVDLLIAQGVQPFHMGERIYRVENAVTLLAGLLSK